MKEIRKEKEGDAAASLRPPLPTLPGCPPWRCGGVTVASWETDGIRSLFTTHPSKKTERKFQIQKNPLGKPSDCHICVCVCRCVCVNNNKIHFFWEKNKRRCSLSRFKWRGVSIFFLKAHGLRDFSSMSVKFQAAIYRLEPDNNRHWMTLAISRYTPPPIDLCVCMMLDFISFLSVPTQHTFNSFPSFSQLVH